MLYAKPNLSEKTEIFLYGIGDYLAFTDATSVIIQPRKGEQKGEAS